MPATVAGIHLGPDTHANRPAANASGLPVGSLYVCSDHNLIYQTDGSAWSDWATLGGTGIPETLLDAKGDLVVASAADTAARLAVGTDGQVLTADSAESTGVKWADASGGGSAYYLDTVTLDSTYGDEFTGASLAAKWTRRNLVDGDDTEQDGGGSWLTASLSNAAASKGYLQTGPNTDMSIVVALSVWSISTHSAIGPVIIDASGDGAAAVIHDDGGFYTFGLSAYAWDSSFSGLTPAGAASASNVHMRSSGQKVWMELRRVGNNFSSRLSTNGHTWGPYTGNLAKTITADRIGVLRISGIPGTPAILSIDRFNKTA